MVGLPSAVSAEPKGIESPVARALRILPMAISAVAMSSITTSDRSPGAAIATGLVATPASRVPK